MNWLKVAAVVVGGIVVFFVVDSLIHLFLGLLTAIAFVAIVGGGIYAAVKISGARKRRQVRRSATRAEREVQRKPARRKPARETRETRETAVDVRPVTPPPAPAARHHDVEDDLARLKREMGS
jgi:hypothetical protein